VNFFVPLLQDKGSILFADVRGQIDDVSGSQGNWGLAYRKLHENGWLGEDWILGVNGYFDLRNSQFDNQFAQGGFGLELLSTSQGTRFNAYFPEDDLQTTGSFGGTPTAVLVNNNIFIASGLSEGAYRGFDLEHEKLLWWHGTRDRSSASSGIAPEIELWASAGVFHYDAAATGLEDFTGPRVRTELRLFDTPLLGNDSRVVLAGQYEYDDVRGSQGTGILSLRIPLGRVPERNGKRLSWLARRMVAPIRRQSQIVSRTTGNGGLENALIARTGRQIASATVVDNSTANPGDVITNAGADSVVIVDTSAGDVAPASMVTLSDGQTVIGGGQPLALIGAQSGTAVTFTTPGGNAGNVDFGANGAFDTATDSSIIGLDVLSGGAVGINLDNVNNVLIDNSTFLSFNNTPAGASSILANDSQFEFNRSSLTVNNAANETDGITLTGSSQLLVDLSNISVTSPNGNVIVASGSSRFDVIGSALESVSSGGIVTSDDVVFTLTGSAVSGFGGVDNAIVASGNTLFAVDTSAIGITINTVDTVNGTITNSALSELDVDTNGGEINLSTVNNSVATIDLNAAGGGVINVTQGAPGSGAGSIDVENGTIPAAVTTSGTVNFNQPPPALP